MWSPRLQTLRIGLSAQRVALLSMGGLWPGKVVACDSISCVQGAESEPWQAATSALAQWLAEKAPSKPKLHVVLSGRFVRWQLLPWRPELTQPSELAAYAALRFRDTFGKTADHWQVLHSPQPPGKTVPACAVDAALMASLHSVCEAAGAQLAVVTPYFAAAFDRWRDSLKGKTAWFGVIEPDGVSLGLLQGGDWLGLHSQRHDGDWCKLLPGMMAQIGISVGLSEPAAPLYLVGEGLLPAPIADLPFRWLQPKGHTPQAVPGYRMALGV